MDAPIERPHRATRIHPRMTDLFALQQNFLGRAGWLMALAILGGGTASAVLDHFSLEPALMLVVFLPAHFGAAYHLGLAARQLGRNGWGHGLVAALAPPFALLVFGRLLAADQERIWAIRHNKQGRVGD